jgi:excisionase family DNA binding protein
MEDNNLELKLMSIKEVAEYTKLSVSTLYNYIYHEGLPFIRIGKRRIAFSQDDLNNWILNKKQDGVKSVTETVPRKKEER